MAKSMQFPSEMGIDSRNICQFFMINPSHTYPMTQLESHIENFHPHS